MLKYYPDFYYLKFNNFGSGKNKGPFSCSVADKNINLFHYNSMRFKQETQNGRNISR